MSRHYLHALKFNSPLNNPLKSTMSCYVFLPLRSWSSYKSLSSYADQEFYWFTFGLYLHICIASPALLNSDWQPLLWQTNLSRVCIPSRKQTRDQIKISCSTKNLIHWGPLECQTDITCKTCHLLYPSLSCFNFHFHLTDLCTLKLAYADMLQTFKQTFKLW